MRKVIVLSVDENPKYLYYIPLVVWAWEKYGWQPLLFVCGRMDVVKRYIPDIQNYNPREVLRYEPHERATIAQVSRLYGACCVPDGMLMTSDADMLPLSDYWKPDTGKINCYGRDLTDYHYPICYIAAESILWLTVMEIKSTLYGVHLRRDLREQKNPWILDQDIITERLLAYGKDKINHINRGTDKRTGYPIGRVDRSNWRLDHKELIDAHLPHDILTNSESYKKVCDLLKHVWPKEDFTWYFNYHKEFKKLL